MRAFIIDDKDFCADLARRILARLGMVSRHFSDAETALQQIAELKPDLLLVDYEMEPMNGPAFVKRVRASGEEWSKMPILMITGHTTSEHVRAAAESGVDGYVVKPYSPTMLRQRIEKVFAQRGVKLRTPGASAS